MITKKIFQKTIYIALIVVKSGHLYKNCKNPIISYGIMLFKYVNNTLIYY